MQPKRQIVHVGYQKTASSFLQREVFLDEGLFYAPWGAPSALAIEHFVLRHPCRFNPEEIRDNFRHSKGRCPVVRHEKLLGYPIYGRYYVEPVIRRISKAFPEGCILLCIREQRSMILSTYFQYVRQGGTRPLREMLKDNGNRPVFYLSHFEYDLTHMVLQRFFDREDILVLPVELLKADKVDFVRRLSAFKGIDVPDRSKRILNKRRPANALRALNKALPNPPVLPPHYADYPLRVRLRNRGVRLIDRLSDMIGIDLSRFGYPMRFGPAAA